MKELDAIKRQYQHRGVQIEQLYHHLNLSKANNILVYGPHNTGKTSIVRAMADELKLTCCWFDMLEYYENRAVYESILQQLVRQLSKLVDNVDMNKADEDFLQFSSNITCASAVAFVEKLEKLLHTLSYVKSCGSGKSNVFRTKLVIVLDNIHTLLAENPNDELIANMNKLQELSNRACLISIVYISIHSSEWLSRRSEFREDVFEIPFVLYTNDELKELLVSSWTRQSAFSTEFYTRLVFSLVFSFFVNLFFFFPSYVNLMISALSSYTRCFVQFRSICNRNFKDFVQPVLDDEIGMREVSKLYAKFRPKVNEIIEYLTDHKVVRLKNQMEMSPSMSYLLIASFLASYSSQKDDKKLFVRNQGRVRANKRATLTEYEPRPPKMFAWERVFNIYRALIGLNETDDNIKGNLSETTSLIQQEFTELINLNLVYRTNANAASTSSSSKYLVSDIVVVEQILELANGIDLDISPFLENIA